MPRSPPARAVTSIIVVLSHVRVPSASGASVGMTYTAASRAAISGPVTCAPLPASRAIKRQAQGTTGPVPSPGGLRLLCRTSLAGSRAGAQVQPLADDLAAQVQGGRVVVQDEFGV